MYIKTALEAKTERNRKGTSKNRKVMPVLKATEINL